MPEADLAALVDEQFLPKARLERPRDDGSGLSGGRIQQRPVHAAAEQRGGDEHIGLRWFEELDAGVHRLGERAWHPGRSEQFLHQERHALREPPDPREVVARGVRGGCPDDRLDRRVVKRLEVGQRRAAAAREPIGQLARLRRRPAPEGADAQHCLTAEVVGEILDHVKRVRIRPVQVLQHDQQSTAGAQPAQEAQHRLAPHRRRPVRRPAIAGRPVVARRQAGERHHRLERGQPGREVLLTGRHSTGPYRPQDGLRERTVRRARPRGNGAPHRDQRAPVRRAVDQLTTQPRLPEASRAADHREAAAPIERSGQVRPERSQLGISAHEDRAADPHHIIIAVPGALGQERRPN